MGSCRIEDQLLKNTEKKGNEFTTYIDLSPEDMDAFMPQSAGETMVRLIKDDLVKCSIFLGSGNAESCKDESVEGSSRKHAQTRKAPERSHRQTGYHQKMYWSVLALLRFNII